MDQRAPVDERTLCLERHLLFETNDNLHELCSMIDDRYQPGDEETGMELALQSEWKSERGVCCLPEGREYQPAGK
jgi:hypothetical protein